MPRENIFPLGSYQGNAPGVRADARGRSLYWDLPSFGNIEFPPSGRVLHPSASASTDPNNPNTFQVSDGRQFAVNTILGVANTTADLIVSATLNNAQVMEPTGLRVTFDASGTGTFQRDIFTLHFDTIIAYGDAAGMSFSLLVATSHARIDSVTRS